MKFDGSKNYLDFDCRQYNQNYEFCQAIISRKEQRFQQYKLNKQIQEASQILQQSNTENSNAFEEIKSPIFNLNHLSVSIEDETNKQDRVYKKREGQKRDNKQQKVTFPKNLLNTLCHSIKVNGVNIVLKFFTNSSILQQETHGILSFLDISRSKLKVRWPGDVIAHKYTDIKSSLAKILQKNECQRYIDLDTKDPKNPLTVFFTCIKSLTDVPISIKRMISAARNEEYDVIHISTYIGLSPQQNIPENNISQETQQIDTIVNSLLKQFKNTENRYMKIVLMCNEKNWKTCMEVLNKRENELFLKNKIDLS